MLRKLLVSALFLVAVLPVNSWAISQVNYDLSGYAHGWSISNFWSSGSVSGGWNGSTLSNISGTLSGHKGSVNITGGSLSANGAGSLDLSISRYNSTYTGTISFYDSGRYGGGYDNSVSDSHLNLVGWLMVAKDLDFSVVRKYIQFWQLVGRSRSKWLWNACASS